MGKPISGKHAIEVAAFVVSFEQPFSKSAVDALMSLRESMAKEYPVFTTTNVLTVKMELNKVTPEPSAISGVFLQKMKPDGQRPAWSLRVDANSIVVSCFEYDKWKQVSSKALKDLVAVAKLIAEDQNPLNLIALQVVDRFVGQAKDKYKISDVFNVESKFITKQALESGHLWHIHQGWFPPENIHEPKLLNVINISTNETPVGVITTIEHAARIQMRTSIPASESRNTKLLKSFFDKLHDCNKEIVQNLLNDKQCKAIGIC